MTNSNVNNAAAQQRSVENAARSKNPLESQPDFMQFSSPAENSQTFSLYCKAKCDMDTKTLKWAFKLAERNVSPFYKQLSMGWQPKVKQNDLNKGWARYLVAVDKNKMPVAYSMFRFDMDYGQPVLYCYEMQIEPSVQRQGLGKHMMSALEECAKYWKMDKVVLTVLKNNQNAQAFFKSVGYVLDDSSPDILEKADYEILSKSVTS
ncbi:N-alpha-acetyltransferase 40 [Stomoxys calcitrans]|uniref:N-alpha-acetyltransferase 40 n=1 Tax=Stomoxys calcitrans TaxID=35570 RepID=A0A1I8NPF8_STOCA|nr:N-alpha-acetyltransferase 40 [Stomoxys calcitrans]